MMGTGMGSGRGRGGLELDLGIYQRGLGNVSRQLGLTILDLNLDLDREANFVFAILCPCEFFPTMIIGEISKNQENNEN